MTHMFNNRMLSCLYWACVTVALVSAGNLFSYIMIEAHEISNLSLFHKTSFLPLNQNQDLDFIKNKIKYYIE